MSAVRNDYDARTKNYKELKKQYQHFIQNNDHVNKSPVSSSQTASNLDALSLRNSPHNSSTSTQNPSYHNLTQENENLEEDMRKAKESADMLRSVVLPLETEISTLRTRSNTSELRMKELENIIDEVRLLLEAPEFLVLYHFSYKKN